MRLSARASKGRKFLFKVALDALDGLVRMQKLLAGTRKKRTRGFFMRNGDMDGSLIPFGYHICINLMYSDSEVFEFVILLEQAFCTNCVSISENV